MSLCKLNRSTQIISQCNKLYKQHTCYTQQLRYQSNNIHNNNDHLAIPRYMITSAPQIPPHTIVHTLGLVQGNTVRTRNVARDYFAGIRALFGGELVTYTTLMAEAREEVCKQ